MEVISAAGAFQIGKDQLKCRCVQRAAENARRSLLVRVLGQSLRYHWRGRQHVDDAVCVDSFASATAGKAEALSSARQEVVEGRLGAKYWLVAEI